MQFNWVIDVGDIIMAIIAIGGIPIIKAFFAMRDDIREMKPTVKALDTKVDLHHDWLVSIRTKMGMVNGPYQSKNNG